MFEDGAPVPGEDEDKKDDPIAGGGPEDTNPESDGPSAEDIAKPAAGPGVKR